jgi:hypothetical protein
MDNTELLAQRRAADRGLYWVIGGMMGGVVVGIAITSNYGWTLLNAGFWIGFGLMVGALSGGISYLLYRLAHILFNRKQAQ